MTPAAQPVMHDVLAGHNPLTKPINIYIYVCVCQKAIKKVCGGISLRTVRPVLKEIRKHDFMKRFRNGDLRFLFILKKVSN